MEGCTVNNIELGKCFLFYASMFNLLTVRRHLQHWNLRLFQGVSQRPQPCPHVERPNGEEWPRSGLPRSCLLSLHVAAETLPKTCHLERKAIKGTFLKEKLPWQPKFTFQFLHLIMTKYQPLSIAKCSKGVPSELVWSTFTLCSIRVVARSSCFVDNAMSNGRWSLSSPSFSF